MSGPSPKLTFLPRLKLNHQQAEDLAQFLKRVGWAEIRGCAVDDGEAYAMRYALDLVLRALVEVGFDPR